MDFDGVPRRHNAFYGQYLTPKKIGKILPNDVTPDDIPPWVDFGGSNNIPVGNYLGGFLFFFC